MKTKFLFLFTFCTIVSFAQTNLVSNGDLESWTDTTTLDNWTVENNVSQNTTTAAEGVSSASFVITDNTLRPLILSKVPLTSGVEYVISYSFKYVSSNFGGTHPISMKIIRQGSATTASNNSFALNNNWVNKTTTFTPDQTGDYDLSFSIATFDGESFEVLMDDIKVIDSAILSVNDLKNNESFKLYPTITEGKIYLEKIEAINSYEISVFDINGRKQSVKLQNNAIDLSRLNAGMYFVNFKNNTQNITKKVVRK